MRFADNGVENFEDYDSDESHDEVTDTYPYPPMLERQAPQAAA